MRRAVAAFGVLALVSLPAAAQNVEKAPPGGAYKKVSELVKLPDFLPGLGTLYVEARLEGAGATCREISRVAWRRGSCPSPSSNARDRLMAKSISRRAIIDGAVCILSLAASAGVAPAAPAEEQIKEADKVTQAEARYQNHANGPQRCEICLQFKPPYTCKIVHGPAVRTGWCQYFAARENAH
jgi:hypothetical protein